MLFTRDKLEFNSVVDKDTYKNVEQHYRFEIITDSARYNYECYNTHNI